MSGTINTTVHHNITVTGPLSITSKGTVIAPDPIVDRGYYVRNSGLLEQKGVPTTEPPVGVYVYDGTFVNFGTVRSTGGYTAMDLAGESTVVNHGFIQDIGSNIGLMAGFGASRISNDGTIDGINLYAAGSIGNSGHVGSIGFRESGTVQNSGIIGEITGGFGLVTVTNSGTVTDGISLEPSFASPFNKPGGVVNNQAHGVIGGSTYLYQGTVINAGTIGGGGVAVAFYAQNSNNAGSYGGLVVDDPGAVFDGSVEVMGTIGGVLELGLGSSVGTLSGFGTQFTGFTSLGVDPGAKWEIAGDTDIGPGITLTNDGTIQAKTADRLVIGGTLTGSGSVILDATALEVDGGVAAGQDIRFNGASDLELGSPGQFEGTINGFASGDTIDLTGIARSSITGEHFAKGVLTLTETTGSVALTFANPGTFAGSFALSAAGGGTDIKLAASPATEDFTFKFTQANGIKDFVTVETDIEPGPDYVVTGVTGSVDGIVFSGTDITGLDFSKNGINFNLNSFSGTFSLDLPGDPVTIVITDGVETGIFNLTTKSLADLAAMLGTNTEPHFLGRTASEAPVSNSAAYTLLHAGPGLLLEDFFSSKTGSNLQYTVSNLPALTAKLFQETGSGVNVFQAATVGTGGALGIHG